MPAGDSLKKHPQVEKVTTALIAGENSDSIARWIDPPLSRLTIYQFWRYHVKPAFERAENLVAISNNAENGNGALKSMQGENAESLVAEAFGAGIVLAARSNRLKEMQARHDRLKAIIDGRAEDLGEETFGGESGLLTRKLKPNGTEYVFDSALVKAMSETEKQIAIELGQYQEGAQTNIAVSIVIPGQAGGSQYPGQTIDIQPIEIALPVKR